MNYYALYLNTEGFIEKCLALIRYICNPSSKNYPHITFRVYKDDHMGMKEIIHEPVTYLNMIETGAFNLDKKQGPYTIYIRFESEELEAFDYKPDYPFSFMHLTLYEGDDYGFAQSLLTELNTISWNVKLSFDDPLYLTTNVIGNKTISETYRDMIEKFGRKILETPVDSIFDAQSSNENRIVLVHKVLLALQDYYSRETINNTTSTYDSSIELDKKDKNLFFQDKDLKNAIKEGAKSTIFVTPPEYAKEMAMIAFKYLELTDNSIYFGDSAIGTGALFLALIRYIKENELPYTIDSAIGIDIDQHLALEAKRRYYLRGLQVVWGDSLLPKIDRYIGQKRNLMLVNPPYSRYEDIEIEYRKKIQKYAYDQTGISVDTRAGLYVYHIMIMDKWLRSNGVSVWLVPSIFIQTKYGRALRAYLLNNVRLLQIHLYSEERVQFEKAMISTCLLVFKKSSFNDDDEVIISRGDSIKSSEQKMITRKRLRSELDNWRIILNDVELESHVESDNRSNILFSDLFDIKRGLATGANGYFVMSEKDAMERGIPYSSLKPLLPKARYLKSNVVSADDRGYPICEPQLVLLDSSDSEEDIKKNYPKFYEYLQKGKEKVNGKSIVDRTLVKKRKPWYKQETRLSPMYVMTYMGRNKKGSPPLYFILNRSDAIALNTYICLYPKKWLQEMLNANEDLQLDLLESLNLTADDIISKQTRMYAGTFQKIEPGMLKQLPILSVPRNIVDEFQKREINLNYSPISR